MTAKGTERHGYRALSEGLILRKTVGTIRLGADELAPKSRALGVKARPRWLCLGTDGVVPLIETPRPLSFSCFSVGGRIAHGCPSSQPTPVLKATDPHVVAIGQEEPTESRIHPHKKRRGVCAIRAGKGVVSPGGHKGRPYAFPNTLLKISSTCFR